MTVPLPAAVKPRTRRSLARGLSPLAIAAMAVLAVLILAAVFAPLIAPYSPTAENLSAAYQGPSAHHLLGTDEFGRDLLSRIIYGGRVSLLGIAEATGLFIVIGLPLGLLAGYFGGVLESAVSLIADVSFALPQIIVVLAVLAILPDSTTSAMIVLGVLGAPALAVFISGAAKSVRAELYISAARVTGLRSGRIIARHILPAIVSPLIVQVSLFAGVALLFQTGLDFLGLGTQPPQPSWGAMVAAGATYLGRDLWMVMPPGLVIILAVMSFGLIGDALQDVRADRRRATAGATQRRTAAVRPLSSARDQLPAPEDAILTVHGLSAGTAGASPATIVEDVSFSIRAGQCLGIVGESGCGKTMTVMAVMGLLPEGVKTTAGQILFQGRDLRTLTRRKYAQVRGSGIAMISQEPVANLDPSFTVGHQITEVVRRHRGLGRRQARARMIELLEQVQLPNPGAVAKRYPHQLSGGMAQRALIAIALAANPAVLIADEPTTALDVTVQAEILDLLRRLREQTGLAVILVSHDWGVIADACDAAIVMYAGEVVEEAGIHDVFDQPRHPYSYGLMSSNPHYANRPRTLLQSIKGTVPAVGAWPDGCRFADRCHFATPECRAAEVSLDQVAGGHWSRCLHNAEVPQLKLENA
ncbi:MAG TPA: dipeptide/oligopeptide/nickel ABC transporter permease/ATP-binding protein [Trebonia sp.]|nr:dipeptide/oligopeptide/nickel ABC transporter permease/ATP-binding protein [Trebonia sp.]